MEFKEDKEFNDYIEKYKKLSLKDKKLYAEKQIQEIIASLQKLNEIHQIYEKILFNREVVDIRKDDSNEDDFVETVFVYMYSIKELLASYIERMENRND